MASQEKFTAVQKGQNKEGLKFAVVHCVNMFGEDTGYDVWAFKTNHREGSRWVTCKKGMTLADATEYFEKRVQN
jgi:hypothetical protein